MGKCVAERVKVHINSKFYIFHTSLIFILHILYCYNLKQNEQKNHAGFKILNKNKFNL